MTVDVFRAVVPDYDVEQVAALVWRDLFRRGMLPDEVDGYRRDQCWFPWLRWSAAVQDVVAMLAPRASGATPCEPQLVVHPPDLVDWQTRRIHELMPTSVAGIEFHVDEVPPWAGGRQYEAIACVAVTWNGCRNGGVRWLDEAGNVATCELAPGDVAVMSPDTEHSSGFNLTGAPRIALYQRWLAP